MASVVTPHTICLLRLLAKSEGQEGLQHSRSRKCISSEAVTFVIEEMDSGNCFCGVNCVKRYFSMQHLMNHMATRIKSQPLLSSLEQELFGISEMFNLHKLVLDSFAGLHERIKDITVDKSNLIDLFLRRCQLELRNMKFGLIASMLEDFLWFRENMQAEINPERMNFFVPSFVRERIALGAKDEVDHLPLNIDTFSPGLVPAAEEPTLSSKSTTLDLYPQPSRHEPYIRSLQAFQKGEYVLGNSLMHDFFDNNIFLYFEANRPLDAGSSDNRKEEYKVAVEHASLQRVAISLKMFMLESGSKLLEETLRWAQLNHHETEVQFCLLYKGKMMEKLGEYKLHFTYIEDALVKSLAFNNYALQIHSCLQHIAMDMVYDLKKMRKDMGQNRNLNDGVIINGAFIKLLTESKAKFMSQSGQSDIRLLRRLVLAQRQDYLQNLGLRKKNLFLEGGPKPKQLATGPALHTEFLHLDALLDEKVDQFLKRWQEFLLTRSSELREYQLSFFDAYFQVRLLLRRRDLDTISTYFGIMERIIAIFPEPLLVFRFWSIMIDLLIEKGCLEQAFYSTNFLLKTMEDTGYTKQIYLKEKIKIARIFFMTGKHINCFEELNRVIIKAKEHSLNDVYVQARLLQIQTYSALGFHSKCLTVIRKICSQVMLASNFAKLEYKESEIRVCLLLAKTSPSAEKLILFQRVSSLVKDAVDLAVNIEQLRSVKQLLYIKSRVHHELQEAAQRNETSVASLRLRETEKFIREHAHILYSLDDKQQTAQVNTQFSQLLRQVVAVN